MNRYESLYIAMGITKPRFSPICAGLWNCIASKAGKELQAPGETPMEAWRMFGFMHLGLAPPRPVMVATPLDVVSSALARRNRLGT